MEDLTSILSVSLVSLLGAICPGPNFLIVVKNSLSYSRKVGFLTALGVSFALLIHLSYILIGIGILITKGSFFYHLLKFVGAGYLFYIGCKGVILSFKEQKLLEFQSRGDARLLPPVMALKQGFLTNLLNPECILFFVSLFSQFILVSTPLHLKIGFVCINWSLTLGWFLLLSYVITGRLVVSNINGFRKYIDRVMGVVLIVFSINLGFVDFRWAQTDGQYTSWIGLQKSPN